MTEAKKPIDWRGIERDFTKTSQSIREIAKWYGCSEKAIRLKAKEKSWARPDDAPTARRAGAKGAEPQALPALIEPIIERIRPAASAGPRVLSEVQPEDLMMQGRDLVQRLFDELHSVTARVGEMEEDFEAAAPGSDNAQRREALRRAVSLHTRAGIVKNLALAAKTLSEAGEPDGKKAKRQAGAEKASSAGRFAVPEPPRTFQ